MCDFQGQIKDYDEAFHSQLERTTDSFSLISEYLGRCLFDDISVVENQLSKSKLISPVAVEPKPVVSVVPVVPAQSQIPITIKTVPLYTNPFDEDDNTEYEDNKNPFMEDYDESKNPFADDM